MKRTRRQQELEKKLILEEYDPVTLEDRAENERLLIDDDENEATEREQAAKMVKTAYIKIVNGHAIVREYLKPFALIVMFAFLCVPIFFLVMFITHKWWRSGAMVFAFILFPGGAICAAYLIYRYFIKNTKKLFDVYYFQQNKKRIIIYQNNKFTIYYRNRKEFVCVENKSRKFVEDYERADFMNLKLGFNSLVGNLKYRELKKGGFEIWTPARYDTSTQIHIFSGFASLNIDKEFNPIKVFIGGGRFTSYIYDFKNDLDFKITIPMEILTACENLNIEPPEENRWLSYE